MARMYPNQLSPDTTSQAERTLYEAFGDELDSSYTAFHSVAWQSLDAEARPRDGEADFVIAHPKRGILVLEAKGGGIRQDPHTGQWSSIDRTGRINQIRDPFAQARESKYVLLDMLKQMLPEPRRRINIGHAVAFPDVVLTEALPGLDKPREIVLDRSDLASISRWAGQALAHYRGTGTQRDTGPGEEMLQALMDLLGKVWELRPAMWGDMVREREALLRLTEQQYLLLDVLSRQRRAAVCGCAGSGKTMLAAEKASRLARQGFRVLLTCFNKNLAADLRTRLQQSGKLDIVHFHELCYELAERAEVLPAASDDPEFFSRLLPEALVKAADVLGVRYDAIIVDEGQDFDEDWWIPLQMLLHDPDNGILYIFFDDNQRIYDRHSTFPIEQPPYMLTVNCRNTQSIHRAVMRFYDAEVQPTSGGPLGRPIEVVSYDDPQQLRPALSSLLRRLTLDERIPTDEIVVLTPLSKRNSRLWKGAAEDAPQLADAWPSAPGQVYCTTIHSFKGLECAVIILGEIDYRWLREWADLDSLLYVGCSRARNHLIVLLRRDADPGVREVFTKTAA